MSCSPHFTMIVGYVRQKIMAVMLIRKGEHQDALCVVHHMSGLATDDPVPSLNEAALLEARAAVDGWSYKTVEESEGVLRNVTYSEAKDRGHRRS